MAGFAPATGRVVVVTMGTSVSVNLTLTVAGVTEAVAVTEHASELDSRGTSHGRRGHTQPDRGIAAQRAQLPAAGHAAARRDRQPRVGREFSGGFGTTQLAIGGARPEQTGYLLDGTNIADISDKAPSSLAGALLGVDTVQEFSVQTHGYSAEFGRAAGGIVSVVTKSGTNRFAGSAFEFHRDGALDARNYFDPADPPDFLRNQFGGGAGRPVVRNRLFFFGSYEGLRDRNVVTRSARLPDQAAHDGWLPDGQGGLRRVTIHPTAQPYLSLLFPIPDGTSFGDGTAELRHSHRDPTDEHFGVGKFDCRRPATTGSRCGSRSTCRRRQSARSTRSS